MNKNTGEEGIKMTKHTIKCPKCSSKEVYSRVLVSTFAHANLNTYEVEVIDYCDDEDFDFEPTDVLDAECFDCEHKFDIETKLVDGYYKFIPKNKPIREKYIDCNKVQLFKIKKASDTQ